MATRTEPIRMTPSCPCSCVVGTPLAGVGLVGRRWADRAGVSLPFRGDQLVQPADFPLDRLEAVLLEFEGVTVDSLPGAGEGGADGFHPLLQPTAAPFQDA